MNHKSCGGGYAPLNGAKLRHQTCPAGFVKVASDDERALPRVPPAKGPLTTPAFQEELVRGESGQRASSITDSM